MADLISLKSRKLKAFLMMVVSLILELMVIGWLKPPAEAGMAVLQYTFLGGVMAMGGQTLIDTVAKWFEAGKPMPKPEN